MSNYEHTIDRLSSFIIYMILTLFVLFAGSRIINYSIDTNFYYYYLLKWESCLTQFTSKETNFPDLSHKNYIGYMDNLVKLFQMNSISVPSSNTKKPYVYKIVKTGFSKNQDIFILCFDRKIIIYGLSKSTFNMLDKFIDGSDGNKSGEFKGRLQRDKTHYVGTWNL